MDTFLLADKMIVVIVPGDNRYRKYVSLYKNVFSESESCAPCPWGKGFPCRMHGKQEMHGIKTLKELIAYLTGTSPHIKDIIDKEMSAFQDTYYPEPDKKQPDIAVGTSIKSVLQ